jgi:catalase
LFLGDSIHRLSANFHELPTNQPLSPVANNQRDAAMQSQVFQVPVNFSPSSQGGPVTAPQAGAADSSYLQGNLVREKIPKTYDFVQGGERYRSMNRTESKHLVENLGGRSESRH